ncbi:MAG: alpha-D-ribose 1-methylphosphonate 5-triphosphate diphosphatase [Pseudomonadota bacterium]
MTKADTPPVSLTLRGAQVLRPEGLSSEPLHLGGGKVSDQQKKAQVDLTGYLILPGIVDVHGDGFERHLAPRRGALDRLEDGIASLDAELAANGITTAVLSQFFSWEGGMRGPDFAERMAAVLDMTEAMTDLLLQLRLEINLIDEYPRVLALIERHNIPYVVFNDHLPHDALAHGKRPPRLTGQALKSGRSPEAHLALLQSLHARQAEVGPTLDRFAETLRGRGVILGSHDDPTAETRARYRDRGAYIAEFPETRAAALAASGAGDAVIMGAPNVVRGGSHDKRQSAADLIAEGMVDALVSDYYYPAPLKAAFKLVDAGMPIKDAWALVSSNPANIVGLDDRGTLDTGKRADLVVLYARTRRVEGTVCGGVFSYLSGPLAHRLIGAD